MAGPVSRSWELINCRPIAGKGLISVDAVRPSTPRVQWERGEATMAKHQHGNPVLRLLARFNWQRDPDSWTVSCHDRNGRRARLRVQLAADGITLVSSSDGPWVLTPLEVGRLRAAARDAVLSLDRLSTTEHDSEQNAIAVPHQRTTSPAPVGASVFRQRISLDLPTRPSVHDIAAHQARAHRTAVSDNQSRTGLETIR
jgi:hypothetical protein